MVLDFRDFRGIRTIKAIILPRKLTFNNYYISLARALFHATSTCGQGPTPDRFCDMWFNKCDICHDEEYDEDRRHPIENVVDGSERFWMSPPLSRLVSVYFFKLLPVTSG